MLTGMLAGTLPGVRASRSDLNDTLKEGGRGDGAIGVGTRRLLVVLSGLLVGLGMAFEFTGIDRRAVVAAYGLAIASGGVYINGASPVVGCELAFGGVGISGYGREGGEEGLFEFLRTKAVGIA